MELELDKDGRATVIAPSAKTNEQGQFTVKVPEDVFRDGAELTIGVPEGSSPRVLSRDGKPLTFRIADQSTGKLDLGKLTLYCPGCSP